MDDWQLLRSYACNDSQDAFAEIVSRHVNLVYSAALRQVRETELARDVTQLVFANLARRAKSLKPKGTLGGWLYRDASLTSREILRRERRRVVREQEAVAMQKGAKLRMIGGQYRLDLTTPSASWVRPIGTLCCCASSSNAA